MFHEETVYAKWPPNTRVAERPKNEVDKSNLSFKKVLIEKLLIEMKSWGAAG